MENLENGQITSAERLRKLVEDTFPLDEVVYAFGYGSGVFTQHLVLSKSSSEAQENLVDIILVVKDSYKFHRANIQRNSHHYNTSLLFSSDAAARVTWWQKHAFETSFFRNPRVYFNVTDNLKYGVVQQEDLVSDLRDWKYLYLAGRMHKPTAEIISNDSNNDFESIQHYQEKHNLPAALSASLLIMAQNEISTGNVVTCTPTQVFTHIAGLSYSGDFRTKIGAEDPNKTAKLVGAPGQLQRFQTLYQPSIDALREQGVLQVASGDCNVLTFDASESGMHHLCKSLPLPLRHQHNLQTSLAKIVAPAARYQSIKGLVTAGFSRSAAYAARKLSKGIFRFLK
ncbi:hypothetical protein MPSEU_001087000 [Mayamaea pseudoterrestris]|nr:hypothetical protein MPSEU_001087000 [Mayamaea pseudoterrestris]